MNLDKSFEGITAGMANPSVALYPTYVPDEQMQSLGVRRKDKTATQHQLWLLQVSWLRPDGNQTQVAFYDHSPNKAVKKAMAWRGMPVIKRGPRAAKNGQTAAAPAT